MNPRTLADRWLSMGHARLVSGVVLAMVAALVTSQLATAKPGGTVFGPTLGGDYGEFFAVGLLLDRASTARLYDLRLQYDLLHQAIPAMPRDQELPFAYPPFLAPAFRPLARLEFTTSYATWLAISLSIYAASVALMFRVTGSLVSMEYSTAWLLALSFEPFAMECWMGGQLSVLGCLAIAAGLALRKAGRPILGGIALSFLLYKPTLPLLLMPLMVVGRQWRMVGGFAFGAVALGLTSLLVAGESACLDFARLMVGYGRTGASVDQGFRIIKYVDLRAFLGVLGLGRGVASLVTIMVGLPAAAGLAIAWRRANGGHRSDLAWSAAICLTPVLNLYGPVYDVTIVIPGLILAAGAIRRAEAPHWPLGFRWLLALIYASGLASTPMAQTLGFQPLTPALAAMGGYLLREGLRRG